MCRLEENKEIAKYLFLQFVYKTVLQKFQKILQPTKPKTHKSLTLEPNTKYMSDL